MYNVKEINEKALMDNIVFCKKKYNNLMAVVKANAYGHGLEEIVSIIKNQFDFFCVANLKEAQKLKKLLINGKKILILGKTENFYWAIKDGISLTVDSIDEVMLANKYAQKLNIVANLHVAVNTGMNRLGVKSIADFCEITNYINNCKKVKLEGVFTHLYNADNSFISAQKQIEKFSKYVKLIKKKNIIVHIGGSYALKNKIPSFVNMVRCGFFLYGYGDNGMLPVMKIKSKIVKIIYVKKNENIGYGNNVAKKDSTLAIVPMGYADGLKRALSNRANVIINGYKCKIVGKICMDMFMCDVTNLKVNLGDVVEILSNAEYIAKIAHTSPYEILTEFNQLRGKSLIC